MVYTKGSNPFEDNLYDGSSPSPATSENTITNGDIYSPMMMNQIYEMLKQMSVEQICECMSTAELSGELSPSVKNLFKHQCIKAIQKKKDGLW